MVKINKKVEYALMVLKHMSEKEPKDLTSAREICDKFNIPFDTTAKVMQQMNNVGILHSTKGVKGGYTLEADLERVSYLQLAELVEGKSVTANCENQKCSLIETCNITLPIKKLNQHLMYFFQGLTLKELLIDKTTGPLEHIAKVTNS